jgi:ribosomal peptide maturation radical SAM protein 1
LRLYDVAGHRRSQGSPSAVVPDWQDICEPAPCDGEKKYRVALVYMPFASVFTPSIQLGLLKAIARKAGFEADDFYLNLDLADRMGIDVYEEFLGVANQRLPGEWLFSVAAFGEDASRADYLATVTAREALVAQYVDFTNLLRDRAIPAFIEDCATGIPWQNYDAVGFSSTFQQNVASLALARRIKQKHPHIAIIFGGANMDDVMGIEYGRAFSFIDYVVVGEGDEVFPELLKRLAAGEPTDDLLGVASFSNGNVSFVGSAKPVCDLDSLPPPDYDTYYAAARSLDIYDADNRLNLALQQYARGHNAVSAGCIPVQNSRGCWWGQKSHCTFCGLNGDTIGYRSKSPDRALAELDELSTRYGIKSFWVVDNILDHKYLHTLFPALAGSDRDYTFWCWTKANMTREQILASRDAGVRILYPGIESLSTRILQLMHKGSTKLQNLTCLKWCRYYNVEVMWSTLYGFSGERAEDYADELATLRLITHLQPPFYCHNLWMERFAPLYRDEQLFPRKWRRPMAEYSFIYPASVDMEKAAYFFDYELCDVLPQAAHKDTFEHVGSWNMLWNCGCRPSLSYRRNGKELIISDSRYTPGQSHTYTLLDLDADVYEACSSAAHTPAQVCAALSAQCPESQPDMESVATACEALCESGLMVGEEGKFLSLAVPWAPHLETAWKGYFAALHSVPECDSIPPALSMAGG